MANLNISELAALTGKTRETIGKAVADLPSTPGPKGGKLFESQKALQAIYQPGTKGEKASDILALRRAEQISLQMEEFRKERIPLDVVMGILGHVISDMASTLKRNVDRVLTVDTINFIFAEFRKVGEKLEASGYDITTRPEEPFDWKGHGRRWMR